MSKELILILSLVFSGSIAANEIYSIDPISYKMAGKNERGEDAYSLDFELARGDQRVSLSSFRAKIYDRSIEVKKELLEQVYNPKIDQISATSDSGIFGSYVSIRLPFGEVGKCKFARKNSLTKVLYLSTLGTMRGGSSEAKIIDPCHRQP